MARNAQALGELPSPFLSVRGTHVTRDGEPAGALPAPGKLGRIEALFDQLKVLRNAAMAQDPDSFPGVAWLAFDASTPIRAVKSVAYTAAYAGFPNLKLVVRQAGGGVGILNVDALIAVPFGFGHHDPPNLIMTTMAQKRTWRVVWRKADAVVADSEYSSLGEVEGAVARGWMELGEHWSPDDPQRDQAVVYTSQDRDYADLVQIVDAIAATKLPLVAGNSTQRPPAMNITFSGTESVPDHGNPLLWRPTREHIQRAFRERGPGLKACYDQALLRDRTIAGRIAVRIDIAYSGKLETIRVDSTSNIDDPGMISCVLGELGRVSFLPFFGEPIQFVYPFVFTPQDEQAAAPAMRDEAHTVK